MDDDLIDSPLLERSETPPLDDSSDDEAAVTPVDNNNQVLAAVFSRYSTIARRRRRYTGFVSARLNTGRTVLVDRELFPPQDREALEDRLFEADTALAVRLSMRTYKPTTVTVNKPLIDKKCPVIRARHQKEKCTVCQEHVKRGEDIRILPCHHYLHDECMVGWFTTGNAICPVCRDKSFSSKKRKRAKI